MSFPVGEDFGGDLRAGILEKKCGWVLTRKEVRVKMEVSDMVLRVGIRNA